MFGFSVRIVQAQEIRFDHFTVDDGLSQNAVLSIAQDSDGFMWFGTEDGLNRYDGFQFKQFRHDKANANSLSDNYVSFLLKDSKGRLWVGAAMALNLYHPDTESFTKFVFSTKLRTKLIIKDIYEDRNNQLWVSTNHGVYRSDSESLKFQLVLKNEANCVRQFRDGSYGFGTTEGLIIANINNGKFTIKQQFKHDESPNSISANVISDVLQDKHGQIWVATETGGLNLYRPESQSFKRFPFGLNQRDGLAHYAIRKLIQNHDGNIWIGTQEGLSIFNPGNYSVKNYYSNQSISSLNQNSIYALFQDKIGSVWVGTYFGGINVAYAHQSYFYKWQFSLSASGINMLSSVVPDVNCYWVGSEGAGLKKVDLNGNTLATFTHQSSDPKSLGSNLVKVGYRDKKGNIWVGTHGGGLNLLDKASGTFQRIVLPTQFVNTSRLEVLALLETENNQLLVGTQTGLLAFEVHNRQLSPAPLSHNLAQLATKDIRVLWQDRDKNIWIGTRNGLFRYIPSVDKLAEITLPSGITNSSSANSLVNCIEGDDKGNIWIGLSAGGLVCFDAKSQKISKVYTVADGLADNDVRGLIEDKNQMLWISTAKGLSRFDRKQGKFINFTKADGLASNRFSVRSVAHGLTGNLLFGTSEGLCYINPDEVGLNPLAGKAVFTSLTLLNQNVNIGDSTEILSQSLTRSPTLHFSSSQNVFTLQFALLNFIKPSKNSYAYKLEGVNSDWIKTHTPEVTYTNLPPGNYTLWIKGANNDGYWSEPNSIQFEILPPFYKTWWAFSLYLLLISAVVFIVLRYFYMQAKLLKEEELHQTKLNFFTNISHEIRTHLTLITVPVDKLLDENARDQPLLKKIIPVKNQVNRLLALVSELMDFRKAEHVAMHINAKQDNLVELVGEIMDSFETVAENNAIEFTLEAPQKIECVYDKVQLEKVFFNLVSNAFKFTPRGGKITLRLISGDNSVKIEVIDNGVGVAPKYLDKLFDNYFQVAESQTTQTGYGIGLALSKRIVELHGGTLSVASHIADVSTQNITVFTLILPKGNLTDELIAPKETLVKQIETIENSSGENESVEVVRSDERILIVEDDPMLRSLLQELLASYYTVVVADDGQQGLDIAQTELPDLVLSDVSMPKMSGTELCKQLKNDEQTNHIPVILLTAKNKEADEIQGLQDGADIYITKPYNQKTLLLQISNLLLSRRTLREKYNSQFLLAPSEPVIESRDEKFLSKLIAIIELNMENEIFAVDDLSKEIGMSYSVLNKKLKSLTNMSVNDFSKSIRLKRAAQLLQSKSFNVAEVAYRVGFSDRKYFSKEFKKLFGVNPSEYDASVNN